MDVDNRCGNCGYYLEEERYCPKCGTKRGVGRYDARRDLYEMQCVYGPAPMMRTHRCKDCGNEYSVALMLDNEKYCPQCGGETVIVSEDEDV